MSKFLTRIDVVCIGDGSLWMLDEDLKYQSDLLDTTLLIPAGFVYDGNSIPLGNKMLFPGSAALHDFGYRYGPWGRKKTDQLYLEALEVEGAGSFRRHARYLGVRLFGWLRYLQGEDDDGERF